MQSEKMGLLEANNTYKEQQQKTEKQKKKTKKKTKKKKKKNMNNILQLRFFSLSMNSIVVYTIPDAT